MTNLTDETIEKIRKNKPLKKALIDYFDLDTERTLYNYLKRNSPQLSQIGALRIISMYLGEELEKLVNSTETIIP